MSISNNEFLSSWVKTHKRFSLEYRLLSETLPIILELVGEPKIEQQKQFLDKTMKVCSVDWQTKTCLVQFLRTDKQEPYWSKTNKISIGEISKSYKI